MVTRISLLVIVIILCSCAVLKKNPADGNPPGTVKINDTLYIDRTEVANVHWREYGFYLNGFDSGNAYKALPDTLVWKDSLFHNEPLVEYYFRHPGYNAYPAVGISYEQAVEFCKWRTFVVNLRLYMEKNNLKNHREHLNDSFPIKVYYRLPTREEWEMIAAGKLPLQEFPYGYKDVYIDWKGKKRKLFNCVYPGDPPDTSRSSEKIYTMNVKSSFKNSFSIYNMIGNLAEMVSEKGTAKGGSFIHPLDSCKIQINQFYSEPQKWLGFRCVAVKLK